MTDASSYDYIITGAGCAGLSLAVHLIHSEKFSEKKVLVIDQDPKSSNDRTWCFWENEAGLFEAVVRKQWQQLGFDAPHFSRNMNISPYHYKLIHGIEFYTYCMDMIRAQKNFTFVNASVEMIYNEGVEAVVVAGGQKYRGSWVFNSILFSKPQLGAKEYWLLQHFRGWFVQATHDFFDPGKATLMDFRTGQEQGTSFFYVLPFSTREALVEYTLFSPSVLPLHTYEQALQHYVQENLGLKDYAVTEKEFGIIPMTNYRFKDREGRIVYIGTAGGQTKGSSGYTFRFIQKDVAGIVQSLVQKGHPFHSRKNKKRFHFYDSVLLDILHHRSLEGAHIFRQLFEKNHPAQVLKFLDNETSPAEDLAIIRTLPVLPFTKAAFRQLF